MSETSNEDYHVVIERSLHGRYLANIYCPGPDDSRHGWDQSFSADTFWGIKRKVRRWIKNDMKTSTWEFSGKDLLK